MNDDMRKYHEWTSCEVHGHTFNEGRCVDCGVKDDCYMGEFTSTAKIISAEELDGYADDLNIFPDDLIESNRILLKDKARLEFLISTLNERGAFCYFVNDLVPDMQTSQRRGTDTEWRGMIDRAMK